MTAWRPVCPLRRKRLTPPRCEAAVSARTPAHAPSLRTACQPYSYLAWRHANADCAGLSAGPLSKAGPYEVIEATPSRQGQMSRATKQPLRCGAETLPMLERPMASFSHNRL